MTIEPAHIFAAVSGVGTVIFGGVGTAMKLMWDAMKRDHMALEQRADECSKDRDVMHDEIADLKRQVGGFDRCPAVGCPFKPTTTATL